MIKDILSLSLTREIYCVIHFTLQIMLLIEILFSFKHRVTLWLVWLWQTNYSPEAKTLEPQCHTINTILVFLFLYDE